MMEPPKKVGRIIQNAIQRRPGRKRLDRAKAAIMHTPTVRKGPVNTRESVVR